MPTKKADTRDLLLNAAVKVAYENGFAGAALADIAAEAKIPLGNIYYHFKTKDDIGTAIVELRLSRFKKLLQEFDKDPSPKERLCAFVQIKIKNRESLAHGGCPVGTLCSELQKHGGPAAKKSSLLFAEALTWIETQFKAIGKGPDSRGLAIHLLSATQGISILAHTFHDPAMITNEAARLKSWIRSL
jgi:TetR/AcrR family transcriptional regulator, transcriptional repressor for nem operon